MIMDENEREELRREIHNALGGNGWAYSDYGYNEIVSCVKELNAVIDLFEKWRNGEIRGKRDLAIEECPCGCHLFETDE